MTEMHMNLWFGAMVLVLLFEAWFWFGPGAVKRRQSRELDDLKFAVRTLYGSPRDCRVPARIPNSPR